jgi:hypothetical protein
MPQTNHYVAAMKRLKLATFEPLFQCVGCGKSFNSPYRDRQRMRFARHDIPVGWSSWGSHGLTCPDCATPSSYLSTFKSGETKCST